MMSMNLLQLAVGATKTRIPFHMTNARTDGSHFGRTGALVEFQSLPGQLAAVLLVSD